MRGSLRSVLEILQRMARYAIPFYLSLNIYCASSFSLQCWRVIMATWRLFTCYKSMGPCNKSVIMLATQVIWQGPRSKMHCTFLLALARQPFSVRMIPLQHRVDDAAQLYA